VVAVGGLATDDVTTTSRDQVLAPALSVLVEKVTEAGTGQRKNDGVPASDIGTAVDSPHAGRSLTHVRQ